MGPGANGVIGVLVMWHAEEELSSACAPVASRCMVGSLAQAPLERPGNATCHLAQVRAWFVHFIKTCYELMWKFIAELESHNNGWRYSQPAHSTGHNSVGQVEKSQSTSTCSSALFARVVVLSPWTTQHEIWSQLNRVDISFNAFIGP